MLASGKNRAEAALKEAEVSQYPDFEGIDLILSRGNGQVGDANPQARDSNLAQLMTENSMTEGSPAAIRGWLGPAARSSLTVKIRP